MKENMMLLLVLLFLLIVSVFALLYMAFKFIGEKRKRRRRWARINVPTEKMITCKISEPREFAGDSEFIVNDINMAGIAFFTNKKIEKTRLKLFVKFPFTSFSDASTVWGKVAYCNKVSDSDKYRVGICYVRQKKRSK